MKSNIDDLSDDNIVLRDIIDLYLKKWKWFVLGAVLSLVITFIALRFVSPMYQINSSIKIKDDSSRGAISELAVIEDMGMFMNQKSNVENEIKVIASRNLLENVVKSLHLNIQYFEKGKTFIEDISNLFRGAAYDKEIYINHPININFLEKDSILYNKRAVFEITIISLEKMKFKELDVEKEIDVYVAYGNKITTSIGDIIITPSIKNIEDYYNKTIKVDVIPIQSVVDYLKSNVKISPVSDTEIINLAIKSEVKEKGIDILNFLIMHYNEDIVREKGLISERTSDFISNRLKIVSEELTVVDKSIENYRTQYNIIDIASQSGINLQNESINDQKLIEVHNQLNMVNAVEENIDNQEKINILPENLGFSDASLTSTTAKYNELVIRRNEMLKGVSEIHPVIVNLDQQLLSLRTTIKQGVRNVKKSLQITVDGLNRQDATLSSKLFTAPKKQRELIDIKRQQAVKESLYLYLLQKREEIAISLGITAVNAKILDSAYSSRLKIYPKKKFIMLVSLIMGLIIPFIIIYISTILDTKVRKREDVESVLRIPILGEIPQTDKKKRIVVNDDRSSTAEAFRLVRTNLDFMLANNVEKSKVIMVTSTIGNEGKTFVALNLAKTLAMSDCKVLLLGLDLRAPTITKALNLKTEVGVTHFITNPNLFIDDITNQFPGSENLDLILSGMIPPNPAELLMSSRLEDLFTQLKEKYNYIIVDTSPLSLVTDTLILNKFSSLSIYVVRANFLDRRLLRVRKSIYTEGKLKNMAVLVNGTKPSHNNYGYGYGYGFEKKNPWYKRLFA